MWVAALSTAHMRNTAERRAGPFVKVVETLAATDPAALETLRWDYDAIVADYFENNLVRQDLSDHPGPPSSSRIAPIEKRTG